MSKLVVEVCMVEEILPHPNADKMKICKVKGWQTCIKHDPVTGISQFKEGDLCIFFPPDAILPSYVYTERAFGKYLNDLPKDEFGLRPEFKRVVATRLRGVPSFGVITEIEPMFGDDPNWTVGTNLVAHFQITKYEPPIESTEGDAEKKNNFFYAYDGPEHFGNFPNIIKEGEEVVFTEKIHGKNNRVGCILEADDYGLPIWTWAAGSHGARRKEFVTTTHRFQVPYLQEQCVLSDSQKEIGKFFNFNEKFWRIDEILEPNSESTEQVQKVQVTQVNSEGQEILRRSEYWEPLKQNVKDMIQNIIAKEMEDPSRKNNTLTGVIVYGEIFGAGVQDMTYGLHGRSFRVFDIAINNHYMDFDSRAEWCKSYNVAMVPVLYRGPFSVEKLEEHTNGPTTMCDTTQAGKFSGREGIVIIPVEDIPYNSNMGGRRIIKSVSADYLARKGGTEFH
jgi:hypothetical protein